MPVLINRSLTDDSEKNTWRTPDDIYQQLYKLYGPFNLDVAANEINTKCWYFLGPGSPFGENALDPGTSWTFALDSINEPLRAFCNPPYSRGMVARFIDRAYHESVYSGIQTTLLVPASVDQLWWNSFVWDNSKNRPFPDVDVYFFLGRINFLRPDGEPAGSPNFASVAVTFRAK